MPKNAIRIGLKSLSDKGERLALTSHRRFRFLSTNVRAISMSICFTFLVYIGLGRMTIVVKPETIVLQSDVIKPCRPFLQNVLVRTTKAELFYASIEADKG